MKYIYLNDIEYLIKKRKKILILLLMIPLIVMLINISSDFSLVERLNICMGTNWSSFKQNNILEFIMLLFNIVVYVFIITDLYVKDIAYQLDNIFLRISPGNWVIKKSIVFIIMMMTMKVLQYLLLILVASILNKAMVGLGDVIRLVMQDFIYVLFIQYMFIFTYVITLLLKKMKFIPCVIFFIVIIIIPKNIYELGIKQIFLIGLSLTIFLYLFFLIFKKYSKRIIENI